MRNNKNAYVLFYFVAAVFFAEAIMKVSTTGGLLASNLLLLLLFSTSYASFLYILSTFFHERVRYILTLSLLGALGLLFSSQMVYYKVFRTFYTLYSLGNASQILGFWQDILILTAKNIFWVLAFFLPAILFWPLGRNMSAFPRPNSSYRAWLVGLIFVSHLLGITAVYASGREQNSAYDLYYKNSYPIFSVQQLGLLTTMRLSLQRLVTWPSTVKAASLSLPVPPPVDTNETIPAEEKLEYNTLNINFDKLISEEKDEVVNQMHKYFAGVEPTAKNDYTGKYKGYNLILITAESFSPYAVRQDVTPTLYKLVHDGYNFTNFYNPFWELSTSDGEYVACTGLIPKSGVWSFYESGRIAMPFVMGNQLKKLGYKTVAYHDYTYTFYKRNISHPNMGYDFKALGKGLNVKKTWPPSDLEMMQKTVSEYVNQQPFHAYYMTVSGHLRYTYSGNSMALKNKKYVQDLPYSEPAQAYIATQIELDRAMEYLLDQLEEAGIADKTLIALSADHYPYGLDYKEIDELAGHQVERDFELFKSPFILYTKGMKPETIDKPASSLDIIPTLSNLLGLEYDSRLLMGRDIFSTSPPLVMFLNRSFITDKGRYDSNTKQFTPAEGVEVDDAYIKRISALIDSKFYYSAKILEKDYYKKALQE